MTQNQPPPASRPLDRAAAGPDDFAPSIAAIAPLRRALDEAVALGVEGTDAVVAELDATAPTIALVGQVKAGKSALANALADRPGLLPVHVNPYTAVVTTLHLAPERERESARFTFFDEAGWRTLVEGGGRLGALARRVGVDDEAGLIARQVATMRERAVAKLGDRFEALVGRRHDFDAVGTRLVARYVAGDDDGDAEAGRYAEITRSAELWLAAPEVPVPLRVVDTPGVNDPFLAREQMTLAALGEADVCVLVLSAHQALSTVDLALLRLCALVDEGQLVVFVNRVDELAAPERECAEIEARLRATLRAYALPAGVPIVFGSALAAGREANSRDGGVTALRRALAETIARGLLQRQADRLAAEGLNAARRVLAAESATDEAPRLGGVEVAARLDVVVAETEEALQRCVGALWRRLAEAMTREADAFAASAVEALARQPHRTPGCVTYDVDVMPLRRALKAAYERTMEEARNEVEAVLRETATALEAIHADLYPRRRARSLPTPPPVPVPPPPVVMARTLSIELDDAWWRRLFGLERSVASLQAELRRLVEAEAEALIEEVGEAHVEPMAREIAGRTRAFLAGEARALAGLVEACDGPAPRAPQRERRKADDRRARLEALVAEFELLAGVGAPVRGKAA